ncbi:hypothetical protein VR556_23690, partial [Escherichia coli]|nr:hypothetical protein [Escherichia coli]
MAYQSQDIIRRSATNGLTPAPPARGFQEERGEILSVTNPILGQTLSGGGFRGDDHLGSHRE